MQHGRNFVRFLKEWKFFRYIISGCTAAATNLGVLFVLVHFFGIWYLLSSVVSFLTAVLVGFLMQKIFTFDDHARGDMRGQTISYLGIQLFNLGVNTGFMYLFVDVLHIHYLISQVLAGGILALYSFFAYKYLIFETAKKRNAERITCIMCGKPAATAWANKNGYQMYRCDSCKLIFVSPFPKETASIYEVGYFAGGGEHGYTDYDRDKEPMRGAFERYLSYVEKAMGKKGRLLDVGCATGYFMEIAKKRGFDVEGVEISEYAAKVGREKGLTIHVAPTLAQAKLARGSFDVITMFDVVEHVPDPATMLAEANRLLRPGGGIAVTTPDAGSLYAKLLGSTWHLVVPPEHLILFSRKNFGDLATREGFAPLFTANIGKQFTLPYIFQTLYRWQGLSLWNALAGFSENRVLAKFRVPINFRDTFFMIAKKKGDSA